MKAFAAILAGFAVMWLWSRRKCGANGSKAATSNPVQFTPPGTVGGNSTTVNSGDNKIGAYFGPGGAPGSQPMNLNATDTGGKIKWW